MHIYLAKSSPFESTDFASVMIDDVGCSRRHQCPQCEYLGIILCMRPANERQRYSLTWAGCIHNMIPDIDPKFPKPPEHIELM